MNWVRRADQAAGGLAVDLALYGLSTAFALVTWFTSTLAPHRAWGSIATYGYAAATLCVLAQLAARRFASSSPGADTHSSRSWKISPQIATETLQDRASNEAERDRTSNAARAALTGLTWTATALVPLLVLAARGQAQEEVVVIEHAGERLAHTGTPYLTRDAIAALPADERLLGYVPYQPGMSLFGLPRALAGTVWWTDARVWFALVTAACLAAAVALLRTAGAAPLIRAVQAATVLPICALTLATGGDDLPVLTLCLLALAFAARGRLPAAGVAVGVAGALKLFAWPVALVLLALAATRGRQTLFRYAAGALGLPLLALVPAFAVDPAAFVENVVRYPLGQGLVPRTAASPFPGHLIATTLPGGRAIAAALLLAAGAAIGWSLLRRPPRDAATAALICAYGLTAAILLMPSTRFGYLLYPVAFLVWQAPLRSAPITVTEPLAR